MNFNITNVFAFVVAFVVCAFFFTVPFLVSADEPLVPCSGADCDFNSLITLIQRVVNFLLFKFAVPLSAISFAIAGVIILTAGGNESKVEKGKEIAWNVVIGLVIALSAWLIVTAILAGLDAKKPLGEF